MRYLAIDLCSADILTGIHTHALSYICLLVNKFLSVCVLITILRSGFIVVGRCALASAFLFTCAAWRRCRYNWQLAAVAHFVFSTHDADSPIFNGHAPVVAYQSPPTRVPQTHCASLIFFVFNLIKKNFSDKPANSGLTLRARILVYFADFHMTKLSKLLQTLLSVAHFCAVTNFSQILV